MWFALLPSHLHIHAAFGVRNEFLTRGQLNTIVRHTGYVLIIIMKIYQRKIYFTLRYYPVLVEILKRDSGFYGIDCRQNVVTLTFRDWNDLTHDNININVTQSSKQKLIVILPARSYGTV